MKGFGKTCHCGGDTAEIREHFRGQKFGYNNYWMRNLYVEC